MSVPFAIGYSSAVLDQGLETREGGSRIRLKTVDEILALFRFDDPGPDGNSRIFADVVMGGKIQDAAVGYLTKASSPGVFGQCVQFPSTNARVILPGNYERFGQLGNFSLRVRVKFDSTPYQYMISKWGGEGQRTFTVQVQGGVTWGGLYLYTSANGITYGGPGLATLPAWSGWHEIQFVMGSDQSAAISLDGVKKAELLNSPYLPLFNPPEDLFVPICLNGYLHTGGLSNFYMDELILYGKKMPTDYTLAPETCQPFDQTSPTAKLSLDSGVNNSAWAFGSLTFADEADLSAGGIKLRYHLDNDNTPAFTGDPLTLAEFKALGTFSGRYLHLEFTFYSDGDCPRVLTSGSIQLFPKSWPGILARRQPEIVRR